MTERRHYLDNIRWITVLLVLVYHVFYLFNHSGVLGGVGAMGESALPDTLLYFVYPWFMVLLFVVSGICARFALQSRTPKQFISERTRKLLVPSTLGLFVFQWISGYFNVKSGGGLDIIPSFIRYPIFAVSGVGPLWFIQSLFIFSLLLLLIRKLDRNDKLWSLCGKCNLPVLFLLFLPIWGASKILNMPVITTYRFGIYFLAFLIGYFVLSHDEIIAKLAKLRWVLLVTAIAVGVFYTYHYFGENYADAKCLESFLTNLYLWISVLAFLGCGKAWLDFTTPFCSYMAKSGFGLYIVHYPVVLVGCYMLMNYCAFPPAINYTLALVFELVLTPIVYELLRRIPIVRYLVLGIKIKKEQP